jgi:predicted RNA binding protein YcfA (HicA-like mRNA interferase family)
MTYREAARKLAALGCQHVARKGGGSHRKWVNPTTNQATVLPERGGRDLRLGTLRAAIRQLGIEWVQFEKA